MIDYGGCKVTVLGLGSFGGGVGAVRFLASRGARVTVTDLKSAEELTGSVGQVSELPGVTLRLGEHREEDFRDADLVVVSPAVPRDNRFVRLARDCGISITSEMNLFWQHHRGRVAAVTGSNGKSTTTALLHAILAANPGRKCWLGGNIGRSLLPQVEEIQADDWVVLELSSFQLEDLAPLAPAPDVTVVTNFSPNHLDRHVTLDEYRTAKQNLLQWQTPGQTAILNEDDLDVSRWTTAAKRLGFGRRDRGGQGAFITGGSTLGASDPLQAVFRDGSGEVSFPLGEWLTLPGGHNVENALAAACAALAIDATVEELEVAMRGFQGLPHRLELVAERGGRRFYNDSKATTPAAASLALAAFDRPIVLLAGGYDKQIDLSGFAEDIAQKVRGVALLGQTAPELERLLREYDPRGKVARHMARDLPGACEWAVEFSSPGDVVLLSPGCASYDWFPNYEIRGGLFADWVRAWVVPPVD